MKFILVFFYFAVSLAGLPKVFLKPEKLSYNRVNATLFTLCRNLDLLGILQTIQNVEDRFNAKYNYDWVFLNDVPFTLEFVTAVSNMVSGDTYFDVIPHEYWSYPETVDLGLAKRLRDKLESQGVLYGNSESYRHMCRFQSGYFYNTSFLRNYKYYWRVEPDVKFSCNVEDVFKFMKENQKKYGFVISMFEYRNTVEHLWDIVKEYLLDNLHAIHDNSFLEFIIGRPNEKMNITRASLKSVIEQSEYNLCHYWNNFEIADMDFYRLETYQSFFNYIDSTNGFFYSRYGDAVIHSIAASLFLDQDEIHFFNDVGYYHPPYHSCPLNDEVYLQKKCTCNQVLDFTFDDYSCTGFWLQLQGSAEVENFLEKKKKFGENYHLRKYEVA